MRLSSGLKPRAEQSQRAGQQHVSSDTRPDTAMHSHRQQPGAPGTWERRGSVNAVAVTAGSASTRSDFPDVHVLLSPGGEHSTAPPCSQGACGTVWVFGFHNSGTHALVEYLTELFDVEVQPPLRSKKRRGDGLLHVGAWKLWKHNVPLTLMALPVGSLWAPITVLLTVRNIGSWLCSMSRNAYELYQDPQVRRRRGSLTWLLEKVQLRAEEANYRESRNALVPDSCGFLVRVHP